MSRCCATVRLLDGAREPLSRPETRLRDGSDRRAVFLAIYVRMTRQAVGAVTRYNRHYEVHGGIERGRFADPHWMRRYLVAFADYHASGVADVDVAFG